jgi:DNA polymerase elongation subunit (family B)
LSNSNYLFDLLMIDIETVPQVPDFNLLSADWQILFTDKISKTMPENVSVASYYKQKAGILAEFAKVICISTGFFYLDKGGRMCMKIKSIFGDDEAQVIGEFNDLVNRFAERNRNFRFAGHNIREFDVPFLCRRMLINGIALPTAFQIQGAKPWEVNMLDTLQWWKFGDYKNYISLHLLASVLGIPTSKSDIDGSMVQDVYYVDHNLPRIVEYCQRDVVVVAQVIQRFKGFPLIQNECILVVS